MFENGNRKGESIKIPKKIVTKDKNPFAHIEAAEKKAIDEKIDEVLAPFKAEEEKNKSKMQLKS